MLKVAYTERGKRLHLIDVDADGRAGRTLCGRYGWAHPQFKDSVNRLARISLSFNAGCQTCIRESDKGEGE